MDRQRLPFDAPVERYAAQAEQLLELHGAGDPEALDLFHNCHPRFLDSEVKWLARLDLDDDDIRKTPLALEDAQLALARWYDFEDWPELTRYAEAMTRRESPAYEFECAVEAVINGDLPGLSAQLEARPELIRDRSTRVTHFDPPRHQAMLLHYLAANGVEGYRQKSPANAVEIAKTLLEAGAEPDALVWAYGGECTTMALLVSSSPPHDAGVQVPLVHMLIDYGAAVEPRGSGNWTSPLMTALVFGFHDAAEALVSRGATIDNVAAAAGLGRSTDVARLLPGADADSRHRAFALAAQLGHTEIVRMLLDAGEDPNRYNPPGTHAHSTPLHQAVCAGHEAAVRLLVERGARLDLRDTIYKGTPLGWAEHCNHPEIAAYLRSVNPEP
jgi:ankyrin repeat protein